MKRHGDCKRNRGDRQRMVARRQARKVKQQKGGR